MSILLLIPLLPLSGSMLGFVFQAHPRVTIAFTTLSVVLSFFIVILFSLVVTMGSSFALDVIQIPPFYMTIALLFDPLTVVMLLLITFMSTIIHFFSARYMLSDTTQARFMAQLSLVTFSAVFLVMSGNLLTAFLGWQWIGLSLYLLLNHYHYDLNANKAAKKKFVINRLGDVCFLLAVVLAYQKYGTSNFAELFSANDVTLDWFGCLWSVKAVIVSLVFTAIMTKSAQFPFHIWLPDTMETPTPVSALMHAGIINAGGFLLARLSPLVIQFPGVMHGIFWVGLITLLSGSFFMLTQTDIKKQLAYSTMGQMGYMTLQCGLGCFPAAVFHLITHGFFKASLFLNSGSALALQKNISISPNSFIHRVKNIFIVLLMTSLIMAIGVKWLFAFNDKILLNNLLLAFIGITIAQSVWQVLTDRILSKTLFSTFIFLTIIFLVYLLLIYCFGGLLQSSVTDACINIPFWQYNIIALLVIVQITAWAVPPHQWIKSAAGKRLYVLSLNKGYIEPFYRRFLLHPLRKMGDVSNCLLIPSHISGALVPSCLILLLLMTIGGYGVYGWWHMRPIVNHLNLLLAVNTLLFIVFLIVANRTKTFTHLFLFLLIIELAFVNIGLFIPEPMASTSAIFHLINTTVLLFALLLLLIQHQKPATLIRVEQNILPWLSIYLSIVLLLLIGIPGTASFVSEFFIFYALLQTTPVLAMSMGIAIVLLAIVILHLLQLYVFNPSKFSRQNPKLSSFVHATCILSIVFNVANGIYPSGFFHVLNQLKGG